MKPIIKVENLSKQYRIGASQVPYSSLRESITNTLRSPLARFRRNPASRSPSFWSLKDVNFEIAQGEVVGIIGRNGAGKSTLLKILSRIAEPTHGDIEIYGRIASLLEVGTGFHPELTGRENIFLNGAILGMKRQEIQRKFDEIVSFAEVEQFVDTPVKHYSSGMYLRLAFAVAAHLEPEILLIDEVLAVGDLAFQKKCLGKMSDVARAGRTVMFVSHNMAAVESLCSRCLLLLQGRLVSDGKPNDVIGEYMALDTITGVSNRDLKNHPGRVMSLSAIMSDVTLRSVTKQPVSAVRIGEGLSIEVKFSGASKPVSPVLGVVIKSSQGVSLFTVNNRFIGGYEFSESVTEGIITCHFETLPLMPGMYFLDLYFGDQYHDLDIIYEATSFEVTPGDVFGTGKLPPPAGGSLIWNATWDLRTGGAFRDESYLL